MSSVESKVYFSGLLLTSVRTVIYLLSCQRNGNSCCVYDNYTRQPSHIDFFPPPLTFCQFLVAFLIVHSEVVPIVEVPVCDTEEEEDEGGKDGCVSNVSEFVFLYPSPLKSE